MKFKERKERYSIASWSQRKKEEKTEIRGPLDIEIKAEIRPGAEK